MRRHEPATTPHPPRERGEPRATRTTTDGNRQEVARRRVPRGRGFVGGRAFGRVADVASEPALRADHRVHNSQSTGLWSTLSPIGSSGPVTLSIRMVMIDAVLAPGRPRADDQAVPPCARSHRRPRHERSRRATASGRCWSSGSASRCTRRARSVSRPTRSGRCSPLAAWSRTRTPTSTSSTRSSSAARASRSRSGMDTPTTKLRSRPRSPPCRSSPSPPSSMVKDSIAGLPTVTRSRSTGSLPPSSRPSPAGSCSSCSPSSPRAGGSRSSRP